ncbi:MAG: TolC family protein [Candidatus Sumerlaeia bacterium]
MRSAIVAGLILMTLSGCLSSPKPPANQFKSEQTAKLLAEGPPKPAATAGISSSPVVPDPVRIEPEKAVGYQDLPTTITQLYTTDPLKLGMAEVVTQTLANNRGLKISGYTYRLAEFDVPISRSIYDLLISGSAQYSKDETQSLSGGKTESRSRSATLSLAQLTPTGATISATYDALYNASNVFSRISGVPDVTLTGTSRGYAQDALIGITQPLLRGFGPYVTNAGIMVAQLERQGAAADFQTQIEQTIASVLATYWQLIGDIEIYKINIISYAAALDLQRVNQAKYEAGVLARVEVVQAEASAEDRRAQLITARQNVRDTEDLLKRQLFLNGGTPLWPAQILPTQPFVWREIDLDLDKTISLALAERSEMRRANSNVEQAQVNERVARNSMLPDVSLFANAGVNGTDRHFDASGDNMRDGDYNSYTAGIGFSYPLQNRAARYRYAQAQTRSAQAKESFKDETDQITYEVRRAVRNLKTARERIDATASAVAAQERKLQDERQRYDVGAATAFEILTFQSDLANSQEQHLQAVVDYNVAAIQVERARGTLLKTFGVEVADPDLMPPNPPVRFPVGLK